MACTFNISLKYTYKIDTVYMLLSYPIPALFQGPCPSLSRASAIPGYVLPSP